MQTRIIRSPISWWILALAIFSVAAILLLRPVSAVLATDNSPVNANLNAEVAHSGFADLVEAVAPAVVSVTVEQNVVTQSSDMREEFFRSLPESFRNWGMPDWNFWWEPGPRGNDQFEWRGPRSEKRKFRQTAGGSGVIIDAEGHVITNNHVVADAESIRITMADGSEYPVKLIGTDEFADLAVLKIESDGNFPYAQFGNSQEVRVGDWVIAIGDPFGLSGTVTLGVLSARSRTMASGAPKVPLFQVDAAINKGNSGGPLFNTRGEVIGLNTFIVSPNGTSVGLNFAVPSSVLERVSVALMQNGRVSRGQLGILIQNITPEIASILDLDNEAEGNWGALVADVEPDSPAERAGIQSGDVVVEYDGQPIGKIETLPALVQRTVPGKEVAVVVWRDGERISLDVTVGEMGGQIASTLPYDGDDVSGDNPSIGMAISELDPELRSQLNIDEGVEGVVIVDLMPDSAADLAGLRPGDVIKSLNQQPITTVQEFEQMIKTISDSGSDKVLVHIDRNGSKQFTVVGLS